MNTYISATIRARTLKFVGNIPYYRRHIIIILEFGKVLVNCRKLNRQHSFSAALLGSSLLGVKISTPNIASIHYLFICRCWLRNLPHRHLYGHVL